MKLKWTRRNSPGDHWPRTVECWPFVIVLEGRNRFQLWLFYPDDNSALLGGFKREKDAKMGAQWHVLNEERSRRNKSISPQ